MDVLTKRYENVRFELSPDSKIIRQAIDIVHKFIVDKGLILVGGQSMHYALVKKGMFLYPPETLPDLDFISTDNYTHAIEIAQILMKKGFSDVNIINAMHVTTRRVRIKNVVVADVTYVPQSIFNNIPFIIYKDLKVIHPFIPIADQLKNIACPTINEPREVIFSRWEKDFKRLQLMFSIYNPLSYYEAEQHGVEDFKEQTIQFQLNKEESDLLEIGYVAGFEALTSYQVLSNFGTGTFNQAKNARTVFMPSYASGITRFVEKLSDLSPLLENKNTKYFDKILDFPARVEYTTESKQKIIYYLMNENEFSIQQQPQPKTVSIITCFWQTLFEYLFYNKPSIKMTIEILKFLKTQKEKCLLSTHFSTPDSNLSHAVAIQLKIIEDKSHKKEIPPNLYENDLKSKQFPKSIDYKSLMYFNSISGVEISKAEFLHKYTTHKFNLD
jgi:hypothetical protein